MALETLSTDEAERANVPTDVLYEVIHGEIVELPSMGPRQEVTASFLHVHLFNFAESNELGWTVMETLFDLTAQVGKKRRPDVAFISYQRWPRLQSIPDGDGWPVVPNLAVEVVSPSNAWDDVVGKTKEYFTAGVELVWIVSTSQKVVHVYTRSTTVHILTLDDAISAETLLPGYSLPLRRLFAAVPD